MKTRKLSEAIDTQRVKADLAELNRLRRFLINSRTAGYTRWLLDSIDDYVEQITGDRTTLHSEASNLSDSVPSLPVLPAVQFLFGLHTPRAPRSGADQ